MNAECNDSNCTCSSANVGKVDPTNCSSAEPYCAAIEVEVNGEFQAAYKCLSSLKDSLCQSPEDCGGDAPYCNASYVRCSSSPEGAICYDDSNCGGDYPVCSDGSYCTAQE